MTTDRDERSVRIAKMQKLRENGINPYPEKFDKTHTLAECPGLPEGTPVKIAGRIVLSRDMGKIIFAHLLDETGKLQIALSIDHSGQEQLDFFLTYFDLGDFIGVEGERFTTKKGEASILVKKVTFLGKALRPLPEKFHGLQDKETKYRQRYLDLITDDETRRRFQFRGRFIKALRDFYEQEGFVEVETSILCNSPSGALAKPFSTHHNSLDLDVFLRIALEIPLKELVIGGYEKVFEIGKCFRNEGMDPSHLQEFTMLEHYAAYWNYEDNMRFTEKMFAYLLEKVTGSLKVMIPDHDGNLKEVDFTPPWPIVTMRDLIKTDSGIDINEIENVEALRRVIREKGIDVEEMGNLEYGNLVDSLYKKVSRPKLVGPMFMIGHPIELSPLARKNDDNPRIVDRFQLVVNGWEIVNAYSELVDPIDQEERFDQQSKAREGGDAEAHVKDSDYVKAMEYGMPPISGWGMGIDRIVALLTQQGNLRDVVLFPLLRPLQEEEEG